MKASDLPLVIAGAGIGGLSAALALSRIGWRVRVLEQAHELKEIGAGIQLAPNAFHALQILGVANAVANAASFPDALVVMDSISGEVLVRVPVGAEFRARFGYPYGLVHRADLYGALLDACGRSPLIALHPSARVLDFEDRGDQVIVRTCEGAVHEAVGLVGADGLRSVVRAAIVGDGEPRVSRHIAYRAVIRASKAPEVSQRNSMMIWAGPRTHLVHYPLRKGEMFNLVAVFDSSRGEGDDISRGDFDELEESFQGTRSEVRGMLARIDRQRRWILCDRDPIRDWSKGRATLLGDAAHPMLQYLAQGASMAMEDAVCVAEKLSAAHGDVEKAFVSYEQARYLRTTRVQLTTRIFGEMLHASGATRDLRNAYLNAVRVEDAYQSLTWLYDARNSWGIRDEKID